MSRSQRAGLTVGVLAACTAVVLGALTLTREPAPPFPAGPTAAQITVDPAARSVFPLSDQELRDLLTAEPDPGPLADPARLVSCLAGLGYPADTEVLGARQLHVSRDPAIVLLTHPPGPTDRIVAVTVGTGCTADDGALVAETTFRR